LVNCNNQYVKIKIESYHILHKREVIVTDRELRKLSRRGLLELLLEQTRENDRLREELQQMENQLAERQLKINQAGSIAEAALQINQVFEAAQKAAEQYLDNVRTMSEHQEEVCQQIREESIQKASMILDEAKRKCQAMEAETTQKCAKMIRETKETVN
jgi:hypothetical protein